MGDKTCRGVRYRFSFLSAWSFLFLPRRTVRYQFSFLSNPGAARSTSALYILIPEPNRTLRSIVAGSLGCRFVCRFLGIDSHDLEHYSNGRNCLKKRSRAPSGGITCKLPVVRSSGETRDSRIGYSSTPRRSVYFSRVKYDAAGAEGVARTIRETIGNCTIVHRKMIFEFKVPTGAFGQIGLFIHRARLAITPLQEVTYPFSFFQLSRAIKGQRRFTACKRTRCTPAVLEAVAEPSACENSWLVLIVG